MALYDTIGHGYAALRRPDARIALAIDTTLGDAASVVNIGAGTGSYEPLGRTVLAVEPSEVMIGQRPAGAAPCVQGVAEALPLETASVDAAMAILSVHHWPDLERGLREMARVARKRLVLLTWIPDAAPFWLTEDYFPEIVAHDRTIFPNSSALTAMLERVIGKIGSVRLTPVPIPHDCTDGFLCAYWRRPECYLSAERRNAISSFARIDAEPGLAKLRADLSSSRWAERNRSLLSLDELDLGYRLACCEIDETTKTERIMPQIVSTEGPVELVDGKLMLRIPLNAGGATLAPLARGIGASDGEYLAIEIAPWLAEKLRVAAGSLVIVDNRNGKFTMTRSAANDNPPSSPLS